MKVRIPALAAAIALVIASSADARTTGKCGSEANAGVLLDGMSQQTQNTLYSAAMSPTSNTELSWALWQPLSGTTHTSFFGDRWVLLNVDPFQDVDEMVASMRGDPLLRSLGITYIEVNSFACFSALPPLQHLTVTEYHNTVLDHYFLSSSEAENGILDSGGAGPGWERTGYTFHPAPVDPCYGMKKVFRFYAPAASTHFFTVDAEECGGLRKEGSGWIAEGIAFGATMPVNGACTGYHETALYRMYNNRVGDPNHRYTMYGDVYRQMIDKGWIGEGVAMCIREGS